MAGKSGRASDWRGEVSCKGVECSHERWWSYAVGDETSEFSNIGVADPVCIVFEY